METGDIEQIISREQEISWESKEHRRKTFLRNKSIFFNEEQRIKKREYGNWDPLGGLIIPEN